MKISVAQAEQMLLTILLSNLFQGAEIDEKFQYADSCLLNVYYDIMNVKC